MCHFVSMKIFCLYPVIQNGLVQNNVSKVDSASLTTRDSPVGEQIVFIVEAKWNKYYRE